MKRARVHRGARDCRGVADGPFDPPVGIIEPIGPTKPRQRSASLSHAARGPRLALTLLASCRQWRACFDTHPRSKVPCRIDRSSPLSWEVANNARRAQPQALSA